MWNINNKHEYNTHTYTHTHKRNRLTGLENKLVIISEERGGQRGKIGVGV